MMESTSGDYFGKKAGAVWKALKENGPMGIAGLKKKTGLAERDAYAGLGWLGREGKIRIIGDRPMNYKFSLIE
jgi:hypothetical protein